MAPAVIVSKGSSAPPNAEDVAALTNTIFTSKASQESLDASYALMNLLLNSVGAFGLTHYGIVEEIRKGAADKKNGGRREGAMFLLGAAFEKLPAQQPVSEVMFLRQHPELVSVAFDALADKGPSVREGAQYALDALYNNLKPEALATALLPVLENHARKKSGKWQSAVGTYNLLGKMADKAKMGMGSREEEKLKDVLRDSMGRRLEELIPVVEAGMHDLKSEVPLSNTFIAKHNAKGFLGHQSSHKGNELSHDPSPER